MAQLGFTFYPKDWWTSDSFFTLNPFERYIYLELLFMMYVNDGFVANNKVNVERRLFTTIKEDVWLKITDLLVKDGDQLTHRSVNARLRKTLANRENGKKGGAPSGNNNAEKQPKQPNNSTQETTQNNPPSEKNRIEVNRIEKNIDTKVSPPPDGEVPPINSIYKSISKTKEGVWAYLKTKPTEIEPYIDFWNLFAADKKLPRVAVINKERRRKFAVRVKEASFDFCRILKMAGESEFLLTGGWFGFDWLIKNDTNYTKILEGNYQKKKIDKSLPTETPKSITIK